ncbi:MAG TPA: hypothetical protein VFP22_10825 [Candidatus Limnocylindrales bacterium]|nr:hypothetical protein [Candidatus Limnocylindrales bacterium]
MPDPSQRALPPDTSRPIRRLAVAGATFALLLAVAGPPMAFAATNAGVGHAATVRMTKVHTTHLAKSTGSDVSETADPETGPKAEVELGAKAPGSQQAKRVPAAHVPTPTDLAITGAGGATGFDGQTHLDQRLAGTGIYTNTNFSTEPPDMGLCVGNGFVVQGVNSSLRVYSPSGTALTVPTALNQLFGATPEVDRSHIATDGTVTYGDQVGDVKCYFDPETSRWFVSSFRLPLDPVTGQPKNELGSHVVLAVSTTADPRGAWTVWDLDTTDGNGTVANHPNCPCFADQPLIGADHYGFYIQTNEYSLEPFGVFSNGSQLYAFNKTALETGAGGSLSGVHLENISIGGGQAFTLQPATTPAVGSYELSQGGTEYFLQSLDYNATLDNRIAVWALTGTSTLGGTNAVTLTGKLLDSESYGQPPDAEQKSGPTPLKDAEAQGLEGRKSVEHLELLAGNDDRMNEVKYASGTLWGDVNTVVKNANGNTDVGIAWFAVQPSVSASGVGGSLVNQGYVAINRANALFGAIAANNNGDAMMGFTVSGTAMYPSVGWVSLGANGATSPVHISAAGVAPEDGFTGYVIEGGAGTARWGDYSAATADEAGNLWVANEYIPNAPRSLFANWGTYITKVTP